MSDASLPWLAAGFGATWILIGAYVLRLWWAQRGLRDELERLDRSESQATQANTPHDDARTRAEGELE